MNRLGTQLRRETGAVLITALVLLVILTLLGLSAMQTSSLEERMAGNMRSQNIAFQATESGLRAGENWLAGLVGQPVANATGSNGIWLLDSPDADTTDNQAWWQDRDESWWNTNATAYTRNLEFLAGSNLSTAPRFLIEERALVRDTVNIGQQQDYIGRQYYQVTSRGEDESGRAEILLRSTFSRRF